MKLIIESTSKIVELEVTLSGHSSSGCIIPARLWEGETASGIRVHCYIARVAVGKDEDQTQFQRELQECRAPSPEVAAIPLRMIL